MAPKGSSCLKLAADSVVSQLCTLYAHQTHDFYVIGGNNYDYIKVIFSLDFKIYSAAQNGAVISALKNKQLMQGLTVTVAWLPLATILRIVLVCSWPLPPVATTF